MNSSLNGDIGDLAQHQAVFQRGTPTAALEGRRFVVIIHIDVIEEFTAKGHAAAANTVAAWGHHSLRGYDWRLGEEDSGKPEKEKSRRSTSLRGCRDTNVVAERRSDRDEDQDGHGSSNRSSR
jgi:hypothetical protein